MGDRRTPTRGRDHTPSNPIWTSLSGRWSPSPPAWLTGTSRLTWLPSPAPTGHVRVELNLMLLSQRRADIGPLTFGDRLKLGAKLGVLTGARFRVGRTELFELLGVLLIDRFDAGLFGLCQTDPPEHETTGHVPRPSATTSSIRTETSRAQGIGTVAATQRIGARNSQ